MLKFVPVLAAKKKGFDVLFEALQEGDRPIRANMTLTLFSPTEEASISSVSNARTYFKELGFELMEDKYFCLPIFLNALPFGADRQAMNDLFRFKTMATRHVIPLLPLFADWKGTGTPVINFVSRNGQIMSVSLYDSGSNYNCCIAAQSGSGKSFLVNEIISSYLSEGGQCWVIDVGRSYEKLCEVYDGEFLQFGRDSGICLNPFEIVEDYDEEADVLVGLLAAMAAPTQSLTDFQMANLKRQTRELWEKKGRAMLVDDVAEALKITKTDVCKTWVSSSIRLRHRANMAVSLMVTTIFASKTVSPFWSWKSSRGASIYNKWCCFSLSTKSNKRCT